MTRTTGNNLTEAESPALRPVWLVSLLGKRYAEYDAPVTYKGQKYYPMAWTMGGMSEGADLNGHQIKLTFSTGGIDADPNLVENGDASTGDNTNFSQFSRVADSNAPGGVAFEVTGNPNLILWSEDFTNAQWVSQAGVAVTANAATDPFGGNRGTAIDWSSTNAPFGIYQSVLYSGPFPQINTKTIYVRADVAGGTIGLADPDFTNGTTIATLTTSWRRIHLTETQTQTGLGLWIRKQSDSPDRIYIFGGQSDLSDSVQPYSRTEDTSQFVRGPDTLIPVDAARDYLAALALEWVQKDGETATAPDYTLQAACYDATGALTGTVTLNSGTLTTTYQAVSGTINPADFPAGTTQIKPEITVTTSDGSPATIRVADVSLTEVLDSASTGIDVNVTGYVGQPVSVYLVLLDDTNTPVADAPVGWTGKISGKNPRMDLSSSVMDFICEDWVATLNRPGGLRFNSVDQKSRPGCSTDTFFDNAPKLKGRKILWMGKEVAQVGGNNGRSGSAPGGDRGTLKRRF